jgi:hypothetical protein
VTCAEFASLFSKEMTDQENIDLVDNLETIAIDALRQACEKHIKEGAMAFAELLYDILLR